MCYMEFCAQDLICTLLRMVILNILIEWFYSVLTQHQYIVNNT